MLHPGPRIRSCSLRALTALCLVSGLVAGRPGTARAECGLPTPDYAAERTVTVAGNVARMRVHVSTDAIREETDQNGGTRVTIRDLRAGHAVAYDPATRQGKELPRPRGSRPPGRTLDEIGADGTRIRVQQIQSSGRWLELSRTTCRVDGVMLRQSFVSLDPQGREVTGTVTQDRILIGPQPAALFTVPPEVQIGRP